MRAVLVSDTGTADALQVADVDKPSPGSGQVLVQVTVVGLNHMDAYQRSGGAPVDTPFVAGVEGVGTIVARGDGVENLTVVQRAVLVAGRAGQLRGVGPGRRRHFRPGSGRAPGRRGDGADAQPG
jgi:NADPH:quinone reductase